MENAENPIKSRQKKFIDTMKKQLLLGGLLLLSLITSAATIKKVAVLEVVDHEEKLSYVQKVMLRTTLAQSITNTAGYEAYSRVDVDAILGEQNFQRTGLVSDDDIKRLGAMAGADYILKLEGVVADASTILVTATILNVESGKMEILESALVASAPQDMQLGCQQLANQIYNRLKTTNVEYLQEQKRIQKEEKENNTIYKSGYKKYSYRGSMIDEVTYSTILQSNCPAAYRQFKKGKALNVAGVASFVVGLVVVGGGVGSYIFAEKEYKDDYDYYMWAKDYEGGVGMDDRTEDRYNKYKTFHALGIAGMAVGGSLTIASIPMWISGAAMKKKSLNSFNNQCTSSSYSLLSLNLTAGQNGLGLALQF